MHPILIVLGLILAFGQQPVPHRQPATSKTPNAPLPAGENHNIPSTQTFDGNRKLPQPEQGIRIGGVTVRSDWVMAGLTGALVILTLGYVRVAWLQVQTTRNTERAWVIVSPVDPAPMLGFAPRENAGNLERHSVGAGQRNTSSWTVKSVGNTPARLMEVSVMYRKASSVTDVPRKPNYSETIVLNDLPLVKADSIGFVAHLQPEAILSRDDYEAVLQQKALLYAFGRVLYKDVYNRRHETKFGYVYHFPQSDDAREKGFRRELLPAEYNRAT